VIVDEEFPVTCAAEFTVTFFSVSTDSAFPATPIANLVTSRSALPSLLPQLAASHHTVCYVANGLYFITGAVEVVG
jgi:hypothetical protein